MALSIFDQAWAPETESALAIMGEAVTISEVSLNAVVSEVEAGGVHKGAVGGVVNSGVTFQVHLSLLQVSVLFSEGAEALKGKVVIRGTRRGRVLKVVDMGGAGVQLDCGPVGDR